MIVNKLNEATTNTIQSWKKNYENAQTDDDKLDVIEDILNNWLSIPGASKILNFKFKFIDSWIKSMKWDELGRDDNPFINLLQSMDSNSIIYDNEDNFKRVYNAYAGDHSIENDWLYDANQSDRLYKKLLTNDRMYQYSENEFRDILKEYIKLRDDGFEYEILNKIFIEPDTGDINTYAKIQRNVRDLTDQSYISNISKDDLDNMKSSFDDMLKNKDMIEYIRTKLNDLNN